MGDGHRLPGLDAGQHVLFGDRETPLTVREVEQIRESEDGGVFVCRAVLDGPRGGEVVLKETRKGTMLAFPRGEEPAHRVDEVVELDSPDG